MKKLLSLILALSLALGALPALALGSVGKISASKAFCWNYGQNAQHGSLLTVVSWGEHRACFMAFPLDGIEASQLVKATAALSATMTFNNGRKSGQAPNIVIVEADGGAINSVDMAGGAASSAILKAAWTGGRVLGHFDTLNNDVSDEFDITELVKSGKKYLGLYLTCREEDGYATTAGIVNLNSPVLEITTLTMGDFKDDEEKMNYDLDNLALASLERTDSDLPLETVAPVSGASISWSSSNTGVVTNDGKVTTPANDTIVTMTATLKKGSATAVRSYNVVILGSDLPVRSVVDGSYVVSAEKYNSYTTRHFQILWGDGGKSAKVTESFLKGSSKILEDCWEIYVEKMGMTPPTVTITGKDTTQYKVNVVMMGTGIDGYLEGWAYGGVDRQGYPYLMCDPDAMLPYPESWVIPHEFGHVTQFGQGKNAWGSNALLGPWYEAIANWFREQYLKDTVRYTAGENYRTDLSVIYLRAANLMPCNGRAYYEAWPILQYLTDNPDELEGYGEKFVSSMLNYRSSTDSLYDIMDKLNPNVSYEDTMGYFASRMATMDFKGNRDNYRAKLATMLSWRNLYWQQLYTVPRATETEGLYHVTGARAPQATGYNIIPLEGKGDISVKLEGLTNVKGAAWRGRLEVLHSDGSVAYSPLFDSGETATVTAKAGDKVYLSVAATPSLSTMVKCGIGNWENKYSEAKIPYESKTQYPYSFTLTNAALASRPAYSGGSRHPNGGGFVSSTAKVAATAYVGKNAAVLGYATVSDNAVITGNAIVDGSAKVSGNAYIGGEAIVNESAKISGNARVLESALVGGSYTVTDNATVKGQSLCLGGGTAKGDAIAYGDFFDDTGKTIKSGAFAGYESVEASTYSHFSPKYAASDSNGEFYRSSDAKLYNYDFNNLRDSVAYSDASGVNGVTTNGSADFNGNDQYLLMPVDMFGDKTTITLKAEGDGGLLYFGGNDGYICVSAENGSTVLDVDGERAVVPAQNGEIRLTALGGIVTLSVNGRSKSIVLKKDIHSLVGVKSYVGKSGDLTFNGSIDSLSVSRANANKPLLAGEKKVLIAASDIPKGVLLVAQYTDGLLSRVELNAFVGTGKPLEFATSCESYKAMIFEDMLSLRPLCDCLTVE